jgi:peptidoglycan hydrolase-like protein with peptidoglycan-binding domain
VNGAARRSAPLLPWSPPALRVLVTAANQCSLLTHTALPLLEPKNAPPQQFGQLGTGSTNTSTSLVAALAPGSGTGILTGATQIAAGGRPESVALSGHTCACLSSGEAVCWGQNTFGQVAAGIPVTTTNVTRPTFVMTDAAGTARLANCKSVAANLNHTLFLTTTGDIYAAGRNGCGWPILLPRPGVHHSEIQGVLDALCTSLAK